MSAVIDIKSKDHHLVVSRANSNVKFWKGDYLLQVHGVRIILQINVKKAKLLRLGISKD